jgi:hypothetical protein
MFRFRRPVVELLKVDYHSNCLSQPPANQPTSQQPTNEGRGTLSSNAATNQPTSKCKQPATNPTKPRTEHSLHRTSSKSITTGVHLAKRCNHAITRQPAPFAASCVCECTHVGPVAIKFESNTLIEALHPRPEWSIDNTIPKPIQLYNPNTHLSPWRLPSSSHGS